MMQTKTILQLLWALISLPKMTEDEIRKERLNLNVFSSFLAIVFISLFTYIDKLPANYVLNIYSVMTEGYFKALVLTLSIIFFWVAMYYKNFSYILVVSVFAMGQFLFIHVYADKYSLDSNSVKVEVKKDRVKFYSIHWNVG